ncbi:Crp/Fnr family transcriptional regulator [Rhodomicrobium sp. Az07]|uniref:Crp/Fnr family transcriptional regulator n=1 Tax=Rhodomicrobium sp. Az07 TaxID=2839034 RepID=UPI001BE62528|nr:Crp/Fnr family transcriptional regulator [Rhodomicrobium sp. Az07]MBT3071688.1 Crp/Fnr family transcriptional regulator [Rhodomicrobium sp. Az07]
MPFRMATLKRCEILRDLPDAVVRDVARSCTWHSVPAGKQIVMANERTRDVYFVTKGKLRALLYSAAEGKPVLFATIGAEEMFGELSALDGEPRSVTIEASSDCMLAVLSKDQFLGLLKSHPELSLLIMKKLAGKVRTLSDRIFEFSTLSVQARVHAELLRLAILAGERDGRALISPAPLLADFAARISTHREAVSRVLSRIQDMGIVRREGPDLHVLDMERLRALHRDSRGE